MEHFCKTYVAPKNKKLKTEELFLYTTPNNVHLQGYIDLQMENKDGSISIFDYKTSTLYSAADMKSHARQLILYALGKEQEGYKVKSASWIFLKYVTVKFMGKKTARSKEKTEIIKHVERRKLGKELEGYLYTDLKEAGYDDMDIEIILDKFSKSNYTCDIPDEVAEKYTIRPCVISVDLSQENKDECIKYIEDTVAKWESLDPSNEFNYPPKEFTTIQKKTGKEVRDTFFCQNLCNHSDKCPYLLDFNQMWTDEQEDDNLF